MSCWELQFTCLGWLALIVSVHGKYETLIARVIIKPLTAHFTEIYLVVLVEHGI